MHPLRDRRQWRYKQNGELTVTARCENLTHLTMSTALPVIFLACPRAIIRAGAYAAAFEVLLVINSGTPGLDQQHADAVDARTHLEIIAGFRGC